MMTPANPPALDSDLFELVFKVSLGALKNQWGKKRKKKKSLELWAATFTFQGFY